MAPSKINSEQTYFQNKCFISFQILFSGIQLKSGLQVAVRIRQIKKKGRVFSSLEIYLCLLKTSATATIAITTTAAAMAMQSVIEGAASVLGGGATEGETEVEADEDGETDGEAALDDGEVV